MKNKYIRRSIFFLLLSIPGILFSQNVGINTTGAVPSTNAILDLNTGNANNLGLIVPNVTLGISLATFNPPMANAPTVADKGMLVYNSVATNQAIGYYYWNGVIWVALGGGGGLTSANNGLSVNGTIVQLGGPIATPAPLLHTSVISGSNFNLDFDLGTYTGAGTGSFLVTNGGLGTPLLSVTSSGVGVNVNPAVSTLDDNGSFGTGVTNIAPASLSTTALTTAYSTVIATPSAAATSYTLTLPSATAQPRQIYTIVYNGNGLGTINITSPVAGSIMLNGAAITPLPITAGSATLQSDGTNWNVISGAPVNVGQSAVTVGSTAGITTDILYPTVVPIPGLTETFNLTSPSAVVVQTHGMTSMTSGTAGFWAVGYVWIDVDGTFYFLQLVNLCNYTNSHFINTMPWAGSMAFNLIAGPHTIAIYCDVDAINNAITNAIIFAGATGTNYESYETVTILHQ